MTRRNTIRKHRSARAGHDAALAAELDQFRSQAEITELAALLDRYSDDETAELRTLVDWTRAA